MDLFPSIRCQQSNLQSVYLLGSDHVTSVADHVVPVADRVSDHVISTSGHMIPIHQSELRVTGKQLETGVNRFKKRLNLEQRKESEYSSQILTFNCFVWFTIRVLPFLTVINSSHASFMMQNSHSTVVMLPDLTTLVRTKARSRSPSPSHREEKFPPVYTSAESTPMCSHSIAGRNSHHVTPGHTSSSTLPHHCSKLDLKMGLVYLELLVF